jgi:hypothetical protein
MEGVYYYQLHTKIYFLSRLYIILTQFGIPVKLVRLIKMCLNGIYEYSIVISVYLNICICLLFKMG